VALPQGPRRSELVRGRGEHKPGGAAFSGAPTFRMFGGAFSGAGGGGGPNRTRFFLFSGPGVGPGGRKKKLWANLLSTPSKGANQKNQQKPGKGTSPKKGGRENFQLRPGTWAVGSWFFRAENFRPGGRGAGGLKKTGGAGQRGLSIFRFFFKNKFPLGDRGGGTFVPRHFFGLGKNPVFVQGLFGRRSRGGPHPLCWGNKTRGGPLSGASNKPRGGSPDDGVGEFVKKRGAMSPGQGGLRRGWEGGQKKRRLTFGGGGSPCFGKPQKGFQPGGERGGGGLGTKGGREHWKNTGGRGQTSFGGLRKNPPRRGRGINLTPPHFGGTGSGWGPRPGEGGLGFAFSG